MKKNTSKKTEAPKKEETTEVEETTVEEIEEQQHYDDITEVVSEIVIKFYKTDAEGNIKTDIQAENMGILAFNQIKLIADWYIENEFSDEERKKLEAFKKEAGVMTEGNQEDK